MRRTLTIIAAVVVVLGLAVGIYFLFFTGNSGLSAQNGVSAGANPFGNPSSDTSGTGSGSTDTGGSGTAGESAGVPTGTATQVAPHLVKITAAPVAKGMLALDATTTPVVSLATSTAATPSIGVEVRYIDRESGNMYAYDAATGQTTRLTDHTAPGVEEASWLPNGSLAYIRFLSTDADKSEHIETYALPADESQGYVLARDLAQVIVRGPASIFAFMPNTSGSVGTLEKPDGSSAVSLFSSTLSALTFQPSGSDLVAYTNPSNALPGYAFAVSATTGAFSRILGPYSGLSVLPSPDGKEMLVSYIANGSLALSLFDPATHAMTALPLATLSEKCVWTGDDSAVYCFVPTSLPSGLPDSWYQGIAPFTDRLWKIDMVARVATQVADLPNLTQEPIDGVAPVLDPEESTIVFMNKSDDSLWSYSF